MKPVRHLSPLLVLAACGPTAAGLTVRILPDEPDTTDELRAELDGAEGATLAWRWLRDGELVADLGSSRVPADRTARGETWSVEAQLVVDGEPGPTAGAEITIGNAAPTATVTLSPERATPASTLVALGEGLDPDGDPVTFSWRWEADGVPIEGATTDTLAPRGLAQGAVVVVVGTPSDGDDAGPEARDQVTLANTGPSITSVAIGPEPLTAAVDAVAQVVAVDAEGDPLTLTYAWTLDGVPAGVSARLPGERLRRGQRVDLTVTATDGAEVSAPASAVPVFVVNAAPTIGRVRLTPSNATTASTLGCVSEAVDDADDDEIVDLDYRWEVNGSAVIGGATDATLEADAIERGDVVVCFARAADDAGFGPEAASNPLTIANAAPIVRNARITTASPRPGEPLTLSFDVADADGDPVVLSYTWRVDGVVAGTGATLPAAAFALGDRVVCDIVAADPFLAAPPVTTPTVTVENGAPTVTQVVFEPASPDVTTDVVAVPIFEDPEGDFVTFTYAWQVNAVPVPAVTGNRLPGGRYRKGQRVSVVVTPSDERRTGAPFTSAELVIANAPPSLASASLSPTFPTRGSGASCVPVGWFDPDLDTPAYATSWFVNGSLVSTSPTLPGTAISRGDLVSCSLVPDDGTDVGVPVDSPLVPVANSTPTLSTILLDPTSPTELDTVTAIAVGLSDPDPSDVAQLTVEYAWRVDDVEIPGVTGPELGPEHFDRGDRISVIAAAFDGFGTGAIVVSGTVEARNLPPEVRSVSLLPDPPFTDSTLSVVVDATDPDPADAAALVLDYTWEVAGSTVLSGPQATLPGTFFRKGQQVRVGVAASDGDLTSERVWTELVTIRNATPTTPVVRMNPRWTSPGGLPLVCQFVVPSTDADGDSLSYTVTWTRDGLPYAAGGGLLGPRRTTIPGDTVPSADVAAGSTWACTLTASDGNATSVPVTAVGRVVASDLTGLAAGAGFTCGLESNGTPRCWGGNAVGQALPPDGFVATRLSVGVSAGCAIGTSGDVACWGFVPSPSGGSFREVGTGTVHACGITNGGSAACWGVNTSGSTSPPSGTWRDLVVGSAHACALDADSDPRCWGANDRGQTNAPAVKFLRLSSGGDFTCGVRTDGTLRCWGATPPGTVPSGTFVDVVAGANHVCALRADDLPVCWGDSSQVELQPPAGVTFATLALGTQHTCGLTTGGVTRCWGDDLQGELRPPTLDVRRIVPGNGITCAVLADDGLACWGRFGTGAAAVPAFVVAVEDVTLGDAHACALALDGEITCWGDGSLGQTASPPGDGWVQIDAGSNHTCAVGRGGAVSCWGSGFRGQLAVPSSGGPWAQVAAGGGHSCARAETGAVVCWGGNDKGQAQAPSGRFIDLAVGVDHGCAVREDTTIACWGDNAARQASPPVLPGWRQVSLGISHGCAVSVVGVTECWGTSAYRLNTIPTLTGFDEVRAGVQHTCGMRVDGREQCWGLYGF